MAPALDALMQRTPGLHEALAVAPLAQVLAACDAPELRNYTDAGPKLAALTAPLAPQLRPSYLSAALLWNLEQFEARFAATGLHDELRFHYADAFHRIIDQIHDDPSFADPASDAFIKDFWLTRAVMIPAFAQVWWPRSALPLRALLRAGPFGAAKVLRACKGVDLFLEGHTHDPVAKAYWNEDGWREALRLAALALRAMPAHRGAFGTAWFYDPAIEEVSPRIRFAAELQISRGAQRLCVGTNPAAIANAILTSPSRRARFMDGTYEPADYMMVWSREVILRAYDAPAGLTQRNELVLEAPRSTTGSITASL